MPCLTMVTRRDSVAAPPESRLRLRGELEVLTLVGSTAIPSALIAPLESAAAAALPSQGMHSATLPIPVVLAPRNILGFGDVFSSFSNQYSIK